MIALDLPLNEDAVRGLSVGDEVALSGQMVTARDAAHKYMTERHRGWLQPLLQGSVIYHCGPVVRRKGKGWAFTAAGPTTSIREEPYQAKVIADYGVRGIIGKGGMAGGTLEAMRRFGAVYLHAIGGAASLLAQRVERVVDVHLLDELGVPEAFWVIHVSRFPVVVTMDAHGRSLHAEVQDASRRARDAQLGIEPAR